MKNTRSKIKGAKKNAIKRGAEKTKCYVVAATKNTAKNTAKATKFVATQTKRKLQNAKDVTRNAMVDMLKKNEDFLKENLEIVLKGVKKLGEKDKKKQ